MVSGILIVCLIFSDAVLDQIHHGQQTVSLYRCSLTTLFVGNTSNTCSTSTYNVRLRGWPFIAHKQYQSTSNSYDNFETDVDSLELHRDGNTEISLNAVLLSILILGVYIIFKRYQPNIDKYVPDSEETASLIDGPLISSSDMLNETGLISVNKGQMVGYNYNILANQQDRVMLFISLHGSTHLHLIAIGDQSKLSLPLTEKVSNNFLTQVSLEGDFPDYFHLYCSPDRQIELREILEPVTMAFLVDFCRTYDLEIFQDSLYVSKASSTNNETGQDTLVTDSEKLLTHIGNLLDRLVREDPADSTSLNTDPN